MLDAAALDRAIAAHAKWKYHLLDAIQTGRSEWRIGDVRSDSHCEFARWLNALPLSERLAGEFRSVRALHAEFHTLAAEVLELAITGQKQEATAAMAPHSRFAAVSSQLILAITAWKDAANE